MAIAGAIALAFWLGTMVDSPKEASEARPTKAAGPSPSPTVSPLQHAMTSVFPGTAEGTRLGLSVRTLLPGQIMNVNPCSVHSFAGKSVYLTDCEVVDNTLGKPLILIDIELHNLSDQAVRFELDSFLFADDSGRVFDPINVRSYFRYSPFLLPRIGLLRPGKSRSGWVTFDGGIQDSLGRSLSYVDRDETLTIRFVGKHHIRTV